MAQNLGAALSNDQLLASAEAALAQNFLPAAMNICDDVLRGNPDNARALLIRGNCLIQHGSLNAGLRDLERSVRLQPGEPAAVLGLCRALLAAGKGAEAERRLTEGLQRLSTKPDLLRDYSELLMKFGNHRLAVSLLDQFLLRNPRDAVGFNMRGFARQQLGDQQDAIGNFTRALMLTPLFHHAANNRGNSLQATGRPTEALRDYDMAISVDPSYQYAWANRSKALLQIGRDSEALESIEKAVSLSPQSAAVLSLKADLLQSMERNEEVVLLRQRATEIDAASPEAWNNLGVALRAAARFDEAEKSFNRAVALRKPYPQALWNRALLRLASGDMAQGWDDFQWRWQCPECGPKPRLQGPADWTGEPLSGKSIAVIAEQGLGDIIQFSRYLPLLLTMAERVVFIVPASMHQLLSAIDHRVELADPAQRIVSTDFQSSLLDLPRHFGTTLANMPYASPYLKADPDLTKVWRERIGANGFKIGIVWQGNPQNAGDRGRSIPLALLAPLSDIPDARLISLQYRDGLDQLSNLPTGINVEVLAGFNSGPDAFTDSAAVMECLDVVVSADTAAIHLAGALGMPAYLLLKRVPDWRWFRDRTDSPWYPSLRLLRQKDGSGWAPVVAELANALRTQVAAERG